jgi:hypothetical protein
MPKFHFRYQIVRQGVRADDLPSQLLRSHSVLVVASETYVQTSRNDNNDLKDIVEGKQNKLVVIVATDAVTGKAVKKLVPNLKANVFVWGKSDFWQTLAAKLPGIQ